MRKKFTEEDISRIIEMACKIEPRLMQSIEIMV